MARTWTYNNWDKRYLDHHDLSNAPNRTPEQVRIARLEAELRAKREKEVREGKTLSGRI